VSRVWRKIKKRLGCLECALGGHGQTRGPLRRQSALRIRDARCHGSPVRLGPPACTMSSDQPTRERGRWFDQMILIARARAINGEAATAITLCISTRVSVAARSVEPQSDRFDDRSPRRNFILDLLPHPLRTRIASSGNWPSFKAHLRAEWHSRRTLKRRNPLDASTTFFGTAHIGEYLPARD
jgi:hypothetical protein